MSSLLVKSPEPPTDARLDPPPPAPVSFRHRFEYALVKSLLDGLGFLPHSLARALTCTLAALVYMVWRRLRRVGTFNLRLAFPDWTEKQRRKVLKGLFKGFGRMLADFAHFPGIRRENERSRQASAQIP